MITICPACRTAFHVTQEQLAAREGRVRCGRCATIFDARDALQTMPEQPAVQGMPDTEDALHDPVRAMLTPPLAKGKAEIQETLESAPAFPAAEPVRKRRRTGWTAGSFLLALGLVAQAAFHYRSEIALLFPETRPVLAELCASLSCEVSLPRRAEQISIESSDLQADPANPSVMVLTATLRNRAAFAQSHPSLELTLTDSQDQPLARRVLDVRDYLGRGPGADAGFPANTELPVKVYMEASSLKATGYRLYLFFP
jgi:predicted Zn finger-like uncharacterized protein